VSRLRSISALLVDVPAGHAAQIGKVLEDAGFKLRAVAANGAEGLTAALQRRGWNVVLYGGEGAGAVPSRKALALVKLADPHLPFIAVSTFVRPGDLAAVIRGLPPKVPQVSDLDKLPALLTRELEQARMRRRVGGAHKLLDAQQAITDHIAAGLEPEDLLSRALSTLGESLGWGYGAVWRPTADSAQLECVSAWHAPGARGPVSAFAAETPTLHFAPGQGLPGRVWAFRRTAWVADVARESHMPRADHALRAGLVTAVAFPLAAADECLGVIELYSPDMREPNAEVAAMFASVGHQLAQYLSRRRVRSRARRSLDGAATLVVGLDADGRVELANRTACALLGREEADLLGTDWFTTALPEAQRAPARASFARLLAGEHGDILALEQALRGGDGRPRPVSWRWSPARGEDGRPVGALGWGELVAAPSSPDGNALVAELAAALAARDRA
jgi:PAS domain S-box-containing protein